MPPVDTFSEYSLTKPWNSLNFKETFRRRLMRRLRCGPSGGPGGPPLESEVVTVAADYSLGAHDGDEENTAGATPTGRATMRLRW
jgi:hypothetical protein